MSKIERHEEHLTTEVKVVKDSGTFGGPNMWHLWIKLADGRWDNVQWMSVHNAERIVGKTLPRYEEGQPTIRRIR